MHVLTTGTPILNTLLALLLTLSMLHTTHTQATEIDIRTYTEALQQRHVGKTGIYILEKGEEALLSRAWLADHAKHSIDVQYFIWSHDNIGTLAAASLLRAAKRGVKVRVIVDDLLVDASHEALYALASHPNIDIRIYNPNLNIGTSIIGKVFNATLRFRSVNQRMHNKVFIVDNSAVITGGRNMADEYFDYDHEYNFRDRDALLIGDSVRSVSASFETYWNSKYVSSIESLIDNPFEATIEVSTALWEEDGYTNEVLHNNLLMVHTTEEIKDIYRYLNHYELNEENYTEDVRAKVKAINQQFQWILDQMHWVDAVFISDMPGKNDNIISLGGGSKITQTLEDVIRSAVHSITIQSPYLVMSDEAWQLLKHAVKRGVKVRISTNSLSSTDNLAAYSGYAKQRKRLLKTGFDIYEFKPDAQIRQDIINRYPEVSNNPPKFAIHAKSLVVDSKVGYIGSFNFDPRSENLNTETGIFFNDETLAKQLESSIETDMSPYNSWNVAREGHSHQSSFFKRSKVFMLKLVPMDAIL